MMPVRSTTSRAVAVPLAGLVALVMHQLAYLVAFPVGAVRAAELADHGHLTTQWALITPLAVVTAAGVILRQVRALRLAPTLRWRSLTVLSAGLFSAQEAIEAIVVAGTPSELWSNPALYIGLALAPLLAMTVVRALRQASELVARFLRPPACPTPAARPPIPAADDRWTDLQELGAGCPRGPPR